MTTRNKRGELIELTPCGTCGKERWVVLRGGKPITKVCRQCHATSLGGRSSPKFNHGIRHNNGYVYLLQVGHPRADRYGYVLRSILVLEKKLSRPIVEGYHPHHLNNVKNDDRPANLIELSPSAHKTLTSYNWRVLRGIYYSKGDKCR